jgi:hypothetical protein
LNETARVHLADGLFEAERGRWRSAAESFETASRAAPDAWAPMLASAICRLRLGEPRVAVVWLETSPCTRSGSAPPPWDTQYAWLCAAARLASGDPYGAERAGEGLPEPWRARVMAHAALETADYGRGVKALLFAFRRAGANERTR